MAIYLNYENPIGVEAAVAVTKIPAGLPGRIKSKTIQGGNAVVLPYTGCCDDMETTYDELNE